MKFIVFALFLFFGCISYSQVQVDTERVEAYYGLGLSDLENNKFEEALANLNSGFSLSKSLDNNELIAQGHLNFSKYYLSQNQYIEAIESVNDAIALYESLNNQIALSGCYSRLGATYYRISNYENSQLYYFKSLNIEEKLGNDLGIAVNLEKIGEIYLLTKDLDKASINFLKAIEIYKRHNNEKGIIYNLTNLGASNQKSGNYEVALKLYKEGLERAEKIKLKRSQSILLGNIGSTNRQLENYQESLNFLFKALDLKMELKRYGSAAHSCSDIAETYIKIGDYKKAKTYALRAVDLSKNQNINEEKFAYYLLSKINYELGEYKDSYINLNNFNKLRDSLFAIEKISQINEMQIKYETEKQEMKIVAQESYIALLNEKNKVKNQYMVFGTVGLLTLFGFIILVRSRNREKQKQLLQAQFSRDLLKSQEKERTRIAKDLHDSVGQQLTLIKRKSQTADQYEISQLTNNALEDVRSISRGLYPAMLQQFGLTESIEQLILEFDESTDVFFSSEVTTIDKYLLEEGSLNFYRFIQEALSNAIKHSEAKAVSVSIAANKREISVTITDNGKGFDAKNMSIKNSLGLKTLSERIQILNGQFKIKSQLNKGTTITALIPIK